MLTLETFGPAFGQPDPSPFVLKAIVLLKMSGLEHETVIGDVRKAPKGKLPVLHDNGTTVPDSTFIRWHLEENHGVRFDAGLSEEQKAVAWSLEKMLEDNLYWAVVHERWMIDRNFERGPRQFFNAIPAPLRAVLVPIIRRQVRRDLHGSGIGRHTREEIVRLGKTSLGAVAGILGTKPYLFGDEPCGADATAFAFVSCALCDVFETALLEAATEFPALRAYCARMTERYFLNLDSSPAAPDTLGFD